MNLRLMFCVLALTLTACSGDSPDSPDPQSDALEPQVEIIAEGGGIAGANGIQFGPDGYLYVASVVGSDITVLDPESGEVIRRYGREDGVIGPDDIAFASDGAFYWTSILTGEVAGFTADGKRVVAAQLAPGVNPITFSDDDRLFVAQCFLGDDLFELDPAGIEPARTIAADLGPGCGLNGMDWGPDDRLYGPRWFTGEVVSFDVDAGVDSMRVEATGFDVPAAVKFNSKGELHVLDTGAGEVVRVADGEHVVVAVLEPGLDNFAFNAADELFVSSFADGFVKRVEPDGSLTSLQPGGMSHAGGVAVLGDDVIVADLHTVRAYDRQSGESTLVQRNIIGVGEMGGAMNVSVDGDNLILTSWFDGDVRIWDPRTRTRVAEYTDVITPVAAVRYQGDIVVADHGSTSVVALSDTGKRTLAENLPAPSGLLVHQGNLYVSDRTLGQILLIASDGKVRDTPLVVADNLETPEGFAITEEGFAVVEADPGRVILINSAGERHVLANIQPGTQAGGPSQPPSQVFNGIALGPDGALYVPGETERVLYRITY